MSSPMNAIKFFFLLLGCSSLFSCGSGNPKEMAREYCACFKEAANDPAKLAECGELAKEHREKMPKDAEAPKIYAEEIIRCTVYDLPESR